MNQLKRDVAGAARKYCREAGLRLVRPPCHIFPRARVLGRVNQRSIVVEQPWIDADPEYQGYFKKFPLTIVKNSDSSLTGGDWCSLAYIITAGKQEMIAMKVVAVRGATSRKKPDGILDIGKKNDHGDCA